MTRYMVLHSDGRRTFWTATDVWVQHFDDPEIPPSPALRVETGEVVLFDPRVRIVNAENERTEYDGPHLWTTRGDRIVPR